MHARLGFMAGEAGPTPTAQVAVTQTENVRKMLLAFSRDLRVVMLRLASRLQTLRFCGDQAAGAGVAWRTRPLQVLPRW